MIDSTYGTSWIHRRSAGFKLSTMFIVSLLLFYVPSLLITLIFFAITVGLYWLAGFAFYKPILQFKSIIWLLLALYILQMLNTNWINAAFIVFRLGTLFLLASLVSLTTPASRILACLERCFTFVKLFGMSPAKISLALSLTLRFITVFSQITHEVREAQKARGLEANIFALIIPVIIRTIKMQDDIANAIDARCYDASIKTNKS